jgi:hypothetical protein
MKLKDFYFEEGEIVSKDRLSLTKAIEVAEQLGVPDDVDIEELRMGMEVEREHLDSLKEAASQEDPDVATAIIALDHLKEFFDYYTRLKKMESE